VGAARLRTKRGLFPRDLWARLGEDGRTLRTKVMGALPAATGNVVLVTSSVPQEGKTTVAVTLARSFAAAERTVLLVDADLRRPVLHTLFATALDGGVSDVVRGRRALDEAIAGTDIPCLEILTAGARESAPAELLGSPPFLALLRELATRYEFVVVDSPPLLSITDTLLLAAHADGILMVVRGCATPREIVRTAFEHLQDRPVLGVVLNGVSVPRRYGYYY
jgi:tyrosine-protein kinase Etk/Wzc